MKRDSLLTSSLFTVARCGAALLMWAMAAPGQTVTFNTTSPLDYASPCAGTYSDRIDAQIPSCVDGETRRVEWTMLQPDFEFAWPANHWLQISGAGSSGNSAWANLGGFPVNPSLQETQVDFAVRVRVYCRWEYYPENLIASGAKAFTVPVGPGNLDIVTQGLPDGSYGYAYDTQLAALGGTGVYLWSVSSGQLPPGLSLDGAGRITGTPTAPGTWPFTAKVASGKYCSATRELQIVVRGQELEILTESLPTALNCRQYRFQLEGVGGVPPYEWMLAPGSAAPPGLTFQRSGILTGVPYGEAASTVFAIQLFDSRGVSTTPRTYRLRHEPSDLAIFSNRRLPTARLNEDYTTKLLASGGTTNYFWELVPNSRLPRNLILSHEGIVQGIPVQPGLFQFGIALSLDEQPGCRVEDLFSLQVGGDIEISPAVLPVARRCASYPPQQLQASGGNPPYTWLPDGELPPGMQLSPAGVVSGIPSSEGLLNVPVRVTDLNGLTGTAIIQIPVEPTDLQIHTETLAPGSLFLPYTGEILASGGTGSHTFSWFGNTPPGLTLSPDGIISGMPTAMGLFTFTVRVNSAGTSCGVTRNLTMTVGIPVPMLSELIPNQAPAMSPDTRVTVRGSRFLEDSRVQWTGPTGVQAELPRTFVSETQLEATVTQSLLTTPGTAQVSVTSDSLTSGALPFEITCAPAPPMDVQVAADTQNPLTPATVGVTLGSAAEAQFEGTLQLEFVPQADNYPDGWEDPALQFEAGGRQTAFSIARGSLEATLSSNRVQISTVAGIVRVRVIEMRMMPGGAPMNVPTNAYRDIVIARRAPVIQQSGSRIVDTADGIAVELTAYSTPRSLREVTFSFAAATGSDLAGNTNPPAIDLSGTANSFYSSAAGQMNGSLFVLRVPFPVTGDRSAIGSVTATLTNSEGSSSITLRR